MDFASFVRLFWKKNIAGTPWTPEKILMMTGLNNNMVAAWWKWLLEAGDLTDDQLIAKWETDGLVVLHTPFGDLYQPKQHDDTRKLVDLTVAEFKAIIGK